MQPTFDDYFPNSKNFLGDELAYTDKVVPGNLPKAELHFRYLFSDVFSPHVAAAPLGPPATLVVAPEGPIRLLPLDDITALFHQKFVSDFNISRTGNECPKDIAEHRINFATFVEQVSAAPIRVNQSEPGSNHLSFVIGNVGQGKSLLLHKLWREILARYTGKQPRCMPVYIDLETTWRHRDGRFVDIDSDFYEMIFERVRTAAAQQQHLPLSSLMIDEAGTFQGKDPIAKLQKLCRWLPTHGYYAMLMIDNGDRFHFAHTRYSFFEQYKWEQIRSIESNFLRLFRDFQDLSQLGRISATIIIVCRNSVFSHLSQVGDGSELHKSPREYPVFRIVEVAAADVLKKRLALLEEVIDLIRRTLPAETERYDTAKRILTNAMRAVGPQSESEDVPMSILQYLSDLSHQGLRSFLDFISRLELDSRDDCQVIERVLATSPRNLLRLYITDMHKRYQQSRGHFPNVFVNDCKVNPQEGYADAHADAQKQTYWLKYVTLKLIQAQPGRCIEFNELRHLLCDICGYEDSLVRLLIGSMCTPHNYKCIDIEYNGNVIGKRKLRISKRGTLLVGGGDPKNPLASTPFCFSFEYLQLMIDDPWLKYPAPWARRIAIANVDIGYTLRLANEYRPLSLGYLKKKAPATLCFLRVLKASWAEERKHRVGKLPEALLELVEPNFDTIGEALMESIRRVLRTYGEEGIGLYSELTSYWQSMQSDISHEQWWATYRAHDPAVC